MRQTTIALALVALVAGVVGSGTALAKPKSSGAMSIVATGFNNPRGLTFGPDGYLYVAEGGLGGTHSSASDPCPQAHGDAAPYFGSTNSPTLGGRISKISRHGVVSTVVSALPSSQTSPALGNLVSGVSAVQFVGHTLYGLLAGAGCSHGVPTVPNGVFRVGPGNSWTLIANLSAFQASHPVAQPDDEDFEPDGTWYSMGVAGDALYPMDSNHGELDRVSTSGSISRVLDISAVVGHVVPTAIASPGHEGDDEDHGDGDHHGHHGHSWAHDEHGHPAFVISNLGVFGPGDGNTPNEKVWTLNGHNLTVRATGVEQVLGLAFSDGKLYALESSATPGGPTPGTGAIVRIGKNGPDKTIVSGLVFPTGMTAGPDEALYVSEQGFGFPAGQGRVVRVPIG
ncbi:MAG TPA: ScyD/ScyE family protein [Gaiellaceae bacterium]|nr:ScyD/ScyE family protein [Gaiellaceae bacterium]